jgi:hypothetical protein
LKLDPRVFSDQGDRKKLWYFECGVQFAIAHAADSKSLFASFSSEKEVLACYSMPQLMRYVG